MPVYGLALCGVCRRPRVVDKSKATATCPYCNSNEKTKNLIFYFEHPDQAVVREALSQATGFTAPDDSEKRKRIEEADPYSTMIYRYEHASDLDEKLTVLAEGLTGIKGTFTLDDVRRIVGDRHAEKYVSAMLDRCIVAEVRIGEYKA